MKSLPFFLARRLYGAADAGRQVSRPAVLIAMTGIAIGLAVMIVSVAVIAGFKKEVRNKVVGFGSHIQITDKDAARSYEMRPIEVGNSLLRALQNHKGVTHVQRFSTKPGMIKTAGSFLGMVLKGVGQDYDTGFFASHLVEGEIPCFTDSVASNKVVISQSIANKLELKLGDKIDTYYIQGQVRARRLLVAGIYQTNFSEFDNLFVLTDLYQVNRLNGWQPGQVSGLELQIADYSQLSGLTWELGDELEGYTDSYGAEYCVRDVEQLNPALFAWLDVLDVNIWVILFLMLGVAGFTMISGLLILILERTSMIGILKSLGANNTTVRRVFLWLAVFLIGRGMLWGNLIGLLLCGVQYAFGIFHLDPETYYMDTVPVSLNVWLLLLLNIGTLVASVLMLIGPSYLIARIHPANSMRYE